MTTQRTYLTLAEVAQVARVSFNTARSWVYSGTLPATRRGRHRLVREDVLIAWLEGENVAAKGGAR